jgi:hypothetical protein
MTVMHASKYVVSGVLGLIVGEAMDIVAHAILKQIMVESSFLQSVSALVGIISGISTALEVLRRQSK